MAFIKIQDPATPGLATPKHDWRKFFILCFATSLLIHLLTAWFSIGFQHPDEQWQIMGFADYKMGKVPIEKVAWEYNARIRPGIQPLIVVFIYRILAIFNNSNPFVCAFLLRALAGIIGWLSLLLITREFCYRLGSDYWRRFLILLSCFIWPMAYIHSHFSSESISGSLFFLGLACLLTIQRRKEGGKRNNWLFILSGALLGLSFVVRNQTAFMILGLGLWCIFIERYSFKKIIFMGMPAILMIALGIVIDYWLYRAWVFSSYQYFYVNLVEGRAAQYGVMPVYFYFYMYYIAFIPVVSIFIMGLIVFSWVRYTRHVLTWVCVPFFLIHCFIGHKETRFLWPLIDTLPLLLVLPFQNLDINRLKSKIGPIAIKVMWTLNIILLIFFCMKPAAHSFGLYEYVYNYKKENGDAAIISNIGNPLDVDGAAFTFQKEHDTLIKQCGDIKSIGNSAHNPGLKNTLVIIDNDIQADSFEKAYPSAARLYKSWPAWVTRMNINNPDIKNKTWYLYKWNDVLLR